MQQVITLAETHAMALAGPGLLEDYREMILGQIAEKVDPAQLFAQAQSGQRVTDADLDEWVNSAVESVKRLRPLFSPDLGLKDETDRLKPSLTSDDFKIAYGLACERHGIRLRESRNSRNEHLAGVFNFDLPDAFRNPIFLPSRTVHVVFDREVYADVRGEDLGSVRGQPIRPVLAGFGEPFADWLFQTAMHASPNESAFSVRAPADWPHGPGWLLMFALRWLGRQRRLLAPDALCPVFVSSSGTMTQPTAADVMAIARHAAAGPAVTEHLVAEQVTAARKVAQDALKARVATRDASLRSTAGLSLLLAIAVAR
jgi:hypothetical protein